jgi:hypothetical protein
VVFLFAPSALANETTGGANLAEVQLMAQFTSWSAFHNKDFETHDEKIRRFQVWKENDGTYCT